MQGSSDNAAASSARAAFLSIGILSVDDSKYAWRRNEQRYAWVNTAHSMPNVHARFVFRSGAWAMSPLYRPSGHERYKPSAALLQENATHRDCVCFPSVPVDAGKLKGPSLGVLAWFAHVVAQQQTPGGGGNLTFVATVDDDAYVHVPDVVIALQKRPAEAGRYVYAGGIVGWSFHALTYRFHSFGWLGCSHYNCSGPFPFAVGAFLAVSVPLAHAIVASSEEEKKIVYALRPNHTLFFQDAFIGQVIYRLAQPLLDDKVDVLNLYDLMLDTDGFAVPPTLAIWHNRYKLPCRMVGIGEYYHQPAYRCSAMPNLTYTQRTHLGNVNMNKYRIWMTSASYRRIGVWHALVGEDALRNHSCRRSVDLRDPRTAIALNLTNYIACGAKKHNSG